MGEKLWEVLFWFYLFNAIFLINHEMDSAYWHEWKLFKLPGGMTGFLLVHFPVFFIVLYGMVLVSHQTFAGLIFSLLLSSGGMFALTIHTYFIRKGHPEFNVAVSLFILRVTGLISLAQAGVTIVLLFM